MVNHIVCKIMFMDEIDSDYIDHIDQVLSFRP